MNLEVTDLLKRALALPVDERGRVGQHSARQPSLETPNQSVEEAWDEEVARRMEDLKTGEGHDRSVGTIAPRTTSHCE
jgi:hypothetical protein